MIRSDPARVSLIIGHSPNKALVNLETIRKEAGTNVARNFAINSKSAEPCALS